MRKTALSCLFLLALVSLAHASNFEDIEDIREILAPHLNPELMLLKYNITEDEFFAVLDHAENMLYQEPTANPGLVCGTCLSAFKYLLSFKSEILLQLIQYAAFQYCTYTKMQTEVICKAAADSFMPIIIPSLAKHYLGPTRVCPTILLCSDYYKELNLDEDIATILKDKPVKADPTPTGRKTVKMLHISDMHIDFEYVPGTEANCGDFQCCEAVHGPAKTPESAAGEWGAQTCDLPPATAIQALRFIEEKIKPDFAVWTGDNSDHAIWRHTREINTNATLWIGEQMKAIFNSTVKVFPIDGNHECYPIYNFDHFTDRENSVKTAFSEAWQGWIGAKAASDVKKQLFYSSFYEPLNLKIIALETNACDDGNYFLLENPTDAGGMLAWLRQELLDAESKGQSAYIIGHIPADNCMDQWARRYEAIVDRFNYTIRGQFFGHSHNDFFRMFYTQDRTTPVGVQFIAGSLTTLGKQNPSFRVFEIDVDTAIPIRYHQYTLNLTKYNKMGKVDKIEWDETYEVLSEYNLTDISPASMHILRNRIKDEPKTTGAKVIHHYHTNDRASGNATSYYCTSLAIHTDQSACQNGKSVKEQAASFLEKLSGPWIERIGNQTLVTM